MPKRKKILPVVTLLAFVQTLASCEPTIINPSTSNSTDVADSTTSTDSSNSSNSSNETSSPSTDVNKKYKVIFCNDNGRPLLTTSCNDDGKITYTGDTPSKGSNSKYIFDGWTVDGGDGRVYTNEELPLITQDTIFIAHYFTELSRYRVRFERDDGTLIEEREFLEGEIPSPSSLTPTKEGNEQYNYIFQNWNKPFTKVSENTTYVANFKEELKEYTIEFLNADRTSLIKKTYKYGKTNMLTEAINLGITPVKAETDKKIYTFNNVWKNRDTNEILDDNTILKGNCVFVPQFGEIIKTYKVEFKYEDGTYISSLGNNGVGLYQYGDYISSIENPTKASTKKSVFTFAGWDEEPTSTMVTGDLVFVAKFTEEKRKYTVNFYNYDGTKIIKTEEVEYGSVPTFSGSTPTKPSTESTVYTFSNKWQNRTTNEVGLQKVTSAVDYIPLFDDETRYYTITFIVGDVETKRTYRHNATINIENPTLESDVSSDYTFLKWDTPLTAVTEDKTYRAIFIKTKRTYTVTYKLDENTVLATEKVEYDNFPKYSIKPTKESTNTENFTFVSWNVNGSNVVNTQYNIRQDTTFIASFETSVRTYKVKFVNDDGTSFSEKSYEFNSRVDQPNNVEKAPDANYTYIFERWDKTVTNVTADVTYTAIYRPTPRTYTITFIDGNNKVLSKSEFQVGVTPSYNEKETPTKTSTAQYSYTFNYTWSPSIEKVSSDAVYVAQFTQVTRTYTVRFENYDGTVIKELTLPYGNEVEAPSDPTRPNVGNTQYTFVDWDKKITSVSGNVTYKAQYKSNVTSYAITFKNYDGSILATKYYEPNLMPSDDGIEPTRPSDTQYSYTFNGWSPTLQVVTGNKEYTAQFSQSPRLYTIKFVDYDDRLLQSTSVEYGEKPTYTGQNPTRISTVDKDFTFRGWDKNIVSVTGETTYKATYDESTRKYVITFKDGNGNVLKTDSVAYGTKPIYTSDIPTKTSTAQYSYTFSGWSPALTEVTGNTTYVAQFIQVDREYTITFVDDEDKVITTKKVKYGIVPTIEDPVKASNAQNNFTFDCWDRKFSAVTSDTTYKASFRASIRSYNVTFVTDDGVTLQNPQTIPYNSTATFDNKLLIRKEDSKYTYTFSKWKDDKDPSTTIIQGDTEFVAIYTKTELITYKITFKNDDGSIFKETNYKKGSTITLDELPTKECNEVGYEYVFKSWTPALTTVTENKEYTAIFEKKVKTYTVKFVDQFGDLIDVDQTVQHGKSITITEQLRNPKKEPTIDKEYSKGYWSNYSEIIAIENLKITSNMTFVYNYVVSVRKYKVTFINVNGGTIISSSQYEYGETVTLPKDLPSLPGSTDFYEYKFLGWSPEVTTVQGNAEYLPVYANEETKKKGKITFMLGENSAHKPITSTFENIEYGTSITNLCGPFNSVKESSNSNLYVWKFEGVFLDGDINSRKMDLTTVLQSPEENWIAVWTKIDITYTVIFTDSKDSNTPFSGCDDFKQVLTYDDIIKKPVIEPTVTDRYGIVLNDVKLWRFSYKPEGSSVYNTNVTVSQFEYAYVSTYNSYRENYGDGYLLRIIPEYYEPNTNTYDGNDAILLGLYPQTLVAGNESVTLSSFAKYGNKNSPAYPEDVIKYDEKNNRYWWLGWYYYKFVYDGPEGDDYYIDGIDRGSTYRVKLKKGESYFFKLEPVSWRRRVDPTLTGGKTMLIASKILDYTNYFNPEAINLTNGLTSSQINYKLTEYSNANGGPSSYSLSNLNSFLNNEFYNELFQEDIKNKTNIRTGVIDTAKISNTSKTWGATSDTFTSLNTKLEESVTDKKIFALSYEEANKFNNVYYDSRNEGNWSLGNYHETNTTASSKFITYEVTGYAKFKYLNTYKKLPANKKFNEYYLRSSGISYNNSNKKFSVNPYKVPVASGSASDRYISLKDIFTTNPSSIKTGSTSQGYWTYDMSDYVSGVVPAMYASYAFWSTASSSALELPENSYRWWGSSN